MALSVHRSEGIGSINCQRLYCCLVAESIEAIEGKLFQEYMFIRSMQVKATTSESRPKDDNPNSFETIDA
jgi:hypothetical protein